MKNAIFNEHNTLLVRSLRDHLIDIVEKGNAEGADIEGMSDPDLLDFANTARKLGYFTWHVQVNEEPVQIDWEDGGSATVRLATIVVGHLDYRNLESLFNDYTEHGDMERLKEHKGVEEEEVADDDDDIEVPKRRIRKAVKA